LWGKIQDNEEVGYRKQELKGEARYRIQIVTLRREIYSIQGVSRAGQRTGYRER
jgi:hypothetical protein